MYRKIGVSGGTVFLLWAACGWYSLVQAQEDYRAYIRTSKDFKRVKQTKEILQSGRWDHWIYMPWRYRWGRKYTDELAAKMKEAGHNGAYCDHGPRYDAAIHERHGFLWYLDHMTGKGELKLRRANKKKDRARLTRPVCLIAPETVEKLKAKIRRAAEACRKYKTRAAYALGDEISWTRYTSPRKWDNSPLSRADFARWLKERYKSEKALKEEWGEFPLVKWGTWKEGGDPPADYITRMANVDDLRHYWKKPLSEWNLAPWCDRLSYMDSQFNNLIGDLVTYANSIDPETPCGFVGGHGPAPYGGSDYVKYMRKVQFLEAYDIGASMEITRSFNPGNMMPTVKTSFGDPVKPALVWFYWYYMVHGDRGVIAWADKWFSDISEEKVMKLGSIIREVSTASRHLYGARWMHDGVALYYSHPSIQVSWFMDAEAHGRTWIRRSSSLNNKLSSSVAAAWTWQKLLEDSRIQYNWISYADVLEKGIDPKEYPVLILPRTLCLSREEAEEITKYVKAGGHVIADHLTGIFDQHGKAYPGGKGILDELFGVSRPAAKRSTLFTGKNLAEYNQDKYWKLNFIGGVQKTRSLYTLERGFAKAQLDMPCFRQKSTGKGWAHLMNVSLTLYSVARKEDFSRCAAYRKPVVELLARAGVKPWVSVSVNGKEPHITEVTYWEKDGRVILCVVKNPLKFASATGETKTEGISKETVPLTVTFSSPKQDVVDEITGKKLGAGTTFTVRWKMDEAAMLSFKK